MSPAPVVCAVSCANTLGEGAAWDDRKQKLYWTDIQTSTLWCHHPASGHTQTRSLPERLACLALCADDDWLLLGLASRLAFLRLSDGTLHPICDVEPGLTTRLNDGACDREGRFVFATLHEPGGDALPQPLAGFYRLDADLSLHRLALDKVAISNSIAFSPEGRRMYFCDSPQRIIRCCDYDLDGHVGPARDFVDLRDMPGVPDGSTVDREGGLWNAQWDMGRVVRYTPDGREDVCIDLPALRPTRPALGGPDLDTLYVTSARADMDGPEHRKQSQAGHVFATRTTIPGLPAARFAGRPETRDARRTP